MNVLCKVFGHKRNAGWWGDGLYGVLRGPTTDGTGRENYTVTLECDRCGERYLAARFHGPLAATLSEDLRAALIEARELILCIEQRSYDNCWWVKADDPETAVCSTLELIDAALAQVKAS